LFSPYICGIEIHNEVSFCAGSLCYVNTLRAGDADLRFLHYNCARRVMQICVFNTRLFSLYNTLNYAIHGARLRMVLLTDIYRNLTSL